MPALKILTLLIPALLGQVITMAQNPILFADVPDLSMVRVGKTYYMSSTTMHMSPGVPIMKSVDLVNWKIISYAYDTLAVVVDALKRTEGDTDPVKLRDAIEQTKGLIGIGGTFNYSPTDHNGLTEKDLVMYRIEGGAWKVQQ